MFNDYIVVYGSFPQFVRFYTDIESVIPGMRRGLYERNKDDRCQFTCVVVILRRGILDPSFKLCRYSYLFH